MKSHYKKIGDFIQPVKLKNTDGKVDKLLGINIDKYFMPSVANVIGVDLTKYRVVQKGQFACNRMHVGRDYRIPVSLSNSVEPFLVSPAYDVFEIKDTTKLDPEYLMMWFSRKEFDRNAWFYTDADVRGGLPWNSFCEIELPIPSIEKQREVVREYNTIVNRIQLNEQLIQKLEETAQAIYKRWFVEFEFPDDNGLPYKSSGGKMVWKDGLEKEIPEGWEVVSLKEFNKEMKSGGTPSRDNIRFWNSKDIPWLKTGEVCNRVLIEAEEYISIEGCKNSSAKILPINTVLIAMYGEGKTKGQAGYLRFEATTNQACCAMICNNEYDSTFLYYFLRINQSEIANLANGGAQPNLSKDLIENIRIIRPNSKDIGKHHFVKFINQSENLERENQKLMELKGLLLSRMAKVKSEVEIEEK